LSCFSFVLLFLFCFSCFSFNRATLQVARKLVGYLLSVDKSGQPFQVRTAPKPIPTKKKARRRLAAA